MKNEYKGCECSHLIDRITSTSTAKDIGEMQKNLVNLVKKMEDFYQNRGDNDEEEEDVKPDVTCASKDYSDALSVDASFLNQLADKFCSGDTSKKRSQDLTAKDVSSSAYADYKFHFELDPGKECKMDCKAAFKSMTSTCTVFLPVSHIYILAHQLIDYATGQGIDSHSIQASANAKYTSCNGSLKYKITNTKTFTQHGLQERVCHDEDAFGNHGDVRIYDMRDYVFACTELDDEKAKMQAGSEKIQFKSTYGRTQLAFTISWIEDCEGEELDVRWPKEKGHSDESCFRLFREDWEKCKFNALS